VSPSQNNVAAYTKDGYTLYANYDPAVHQLALDANSPCVWPNGTQPPTS
jgi:hypothetical protein